MTEHVAPARIALAEDESDVRKILVRLIEQLGHRVVCSAADGDELVSACRQHSVDLAIVDLNMPRIDGLAAAEDIAELGIPVVLVSGHPDVEQVVLDQEPIVARLLKPVAAADLQRAIAAAMPT